MIRRITQTALNCRHRRAYLIGFEGNEFERDLGIVKAELFALGFQHEDIRHFRKTEGISIA